MKWLDSVTLGQLVLAGSLGGCGAAADRDVVVPGGKFPLQCTDTQESTINFTGGALSPLSLSVV